MSFTIPMLAEADAGADDPALLVLWLLHASLDEKRGDRAAVLRRHRAARTLAERAFGPLNGRAVALLGRPAEGE